MPVGDCQREFEAAAVEDGVELRPQRFPWLCQRGHLALPENAPERTALEQIYIAVGGDLEALASARATPLRGDFVHEPSGTLIEFDEFQHFSTARLTTLQLYPRGTPLGFKLEEYVVLCEEHRARADRYRATKAARGFGRGGRTRQRAYYDSLRDLATLALGRPPIVRIAAPNNDGRAAYHAHRHVLRGLMT